jgi:hypothetical protein
MHQCLVEAEESTRYMSQTNTDQVQVIDGVTSKSQWVNIVIQRSIIYLNLSEVMVSTEFICTKLPYIVAIYNNYSDIVLDVMVGYVSKCGILWRKVNMAFSGRTDT